MLRCVHCSVVAVVDTMLWHHESHVFIGDTAYLIVQAVLLHPKHTALRPHATAPCMHMLLASTRACSAAHRDDTLEEGKEHQRVAQDDAGAHLQGRAPCWVTLRCAVMLP